MKSRDFAFWIACLGTLSATTAGPENGWSWVNPLPQGDNLGEINFPTPTTGYAVGTYGAMIKTTDAGATWATVPVGTREDIGAVFFKSADAGLVATTRGRFLKTLDGGKTWNQVSRDSSFSVYSLTFLDDSTVFASGKHYAKSPHPGTIMKSIDAGVTWREVFSTGLDNSMGRIHFPSARVGYAVSTWGQILKTQDGGETWTLQTSGVKVSLYDIAFQSEDSGFVSGNLGTLLRTVDGGSTWTAQASGTSCGLIRLLFTTPRKGYASCTNDTAIVSEDGGTTWKAWKRNLPAGYGDITFTAPDTAHWAGPGGAVAKSVDGGRTWKTYSTKMSTGYSAIRFTDLQSGVLSGNGAIQTLDAGRTWRKIGVTGPNTQGAIWFVDSRTGFRILNSYYVQKTTDGGVTWSPMEDSLSDVLWRKNVQLGFLQFPTPEVGYAMSNKGVTIGTRDGGETWSLVHPDSVFSEFTIMRAMHFTTPDTGFAVGQSESAFRTLDGGKTWKRMVIPQDPILPSSHELRAIHFADTKVGYIAGPWAAILKTSDGGESWRSIKVDMFASTLSLATLSRDTVFVGGSYGAVARSVDAGGTWTYMNTGTATYINGLAFPSAHWGMAVGTQGEVLQWGAPPALAIKGPPAAPSSLFQWSRGLLRFNLAKAAPVRIRLFDLSGRKLFEQTEDLMGPGEHFQSFDPIPFTGLAILDFRAGTARETRTLMLR